MFADCDVLLHEKDEDECLHNRNDGERDGRWRHPLLALLRGSLLFLLLRLLTRRSAANCAYKKVCEYWYGRY